MTTFLIIMATLGYTAAFLWTQWVLTLIALINPNKDRDFIFWKAVFWWITLPVMLITILLHKRQSDPAV